MRKINAKRKQRKYKDEEDDNDDRDEVQDSKNGGSSEKKSKKNDNESNPNTSEEYQDQESETKKKLKRKQKKQTDSSDEELEDSKNNGSSEDSTPKKKLKQNDNATEDQNEEYEVEGILDQKMEGGISYYLIKWKGYDADSNTWEPEDTLSCPDLVAKFKKERPTQKTKGGNQKKNKTKPQKKETEQSSSDPSHEWEVEKVVDVVYGKSGSRTFRIRWKGYRPTSDTWEPEENLNCSDLIEKFIKKREADSKLPQKELREAPKRTERFVTDTFGRRTSKRNTGRLRTVYYDAE